MSDLTRGDWITRNEAIESIIETETFKSLDYYSLDTLTVFGQTVGNVTFIGLDRRYNLAMFNVGAHKVSLSLSTPDWDFIG